MALAKSKVNQMPEDAVVLTEQEALQYQIQLVKKWNDSSDVFALRYGSYFLGGAALLTGLFLNNHFRRKFMLGNYGTISSYLPICAVPAATTMVVHAEAVLNDVVLMKGDQCPVCLELRSSAFQSMIGVIFPLILAPIGCAAIAQRYATINLPYITDKPVEVFNVIRKMFKPIRTTVWYLFLSHALLGSIVTYFEINSIIKIHQKLAMEDQKQQYS